jgi:hypothetical protein
MQRELLRASHHRPEKSHEKNNSSTTTSLIATNQFLINDRSLLNDDQWCRISNIINVYNTKSPVSHIRYLLQNQSKQPIKMRLKMAKNNILDIIILIERNLSYVGGFNGIIVFRDAGVTFSTAFKNGFPSIYGSTIVDDSITIAHRTDNDVTLIKLLIPILVFSTSFNVITPTEFNSYRKNSLWVKFREIFSFDLGELYDVSMDSSFFNTKRLFDIQNVYIEIMFKYMIYRFGYNEAALRFAALIKSLLDQSMCVFRAREVQAHDQLMQTIIKQTETELTFQNEPMDYTVC